MDATASLLCSFWGKSMHEVAVLIKGRGETYIGDECVELCHALVVEQVGPTAQAGLRHRTADQPPTECQT